MSSAPVPEAPVALSSLPTSLSRLLLLEPAGGAMGDVADAAPAAVAAAAVTDRSPSADSWWSRLVAFARETAPVVSILTLLLLPCLVLWQVIVLRRQQRQLASTCCAGRGESAVGTDEDTTTEWTPASATGDDGV